MTKARDIADVIDAILVHVPLGLLHSDLLKLKSDACYLSPEQMPEAWARGTTLLAKEFGPTPPTEGWQGEVVRIWLGD